MMYSKKSPVFLTIIAALIGIDVVMADTRLSLFKSAMADLRQNNITAFEEKKAALKNHPLEQHLEYQMLKRRLTLADEADVKSFLGQYPRSYVAEKIRLKWLALLVQKGKWELVLKYINDYYSSNMLCLRAIAKYKAYDKSLDSSALNKRWLSAKNQPHYCRSLFKMYHKQGGLTAENIWLRFSKAMQDHNIQLAKQTRGFMTQDYKEKADLWLQFHKDAWAVRKITVKNTEIGREIVTHGLRRLAARRPYQAIEHWNKIKEKYNFSQAQEYRIFDKIALRLATRGNPLADRWFAKIPIEDMEPYSREWFIRSAIAQEKWVAVIKRIKSLSADSQQRAIWRYWRAHAHHALKQIDIAKPIFQELTKERHFYALLASVALDVPMKLHHQIPAYTVSELAAIENHPGIVRAKLLYQAKYFTTARREWYHVTKNFSEKEKYLAAVIADRWGWHEKAIHTLRKLPNQNDLNVRFPLGYREKVKPIAKQLKVNPALIYAIIRQESSFMHDARSPAGAIGVMQVMPMTAKRYNKKLKKNFGNIDELFHVPNNLLVGITHFKHLLNKLDGHPVPALAAYNAGLRNVNRWLRKKTPISTIIWIETIPFYETREYLKNIITYTAIYHHHLGKPLDISKLIRDLS